MTGDLLIICAYSEYTEAELKAYRPVVVLVDERNRPRRHSIQGEAAGR
jgi:aspartate 1-decarboxylase